MKYPGSLSGSPSVSFLDVYPFTCKTQCFPTFFCVCPAFCFTAYSLVVVKSTVTFFIAFLASLSVALDLRSSSALISGYFCHRSLDIWTHALGAGQNVHFPRLLGLCVCFCVCVCVCELTVSHQSFFGTLHLPSLVLSETVGVAQSFDIFLGTPFSLMISATVIMRYDPSALCIIFFYVKLSVFFWANRTNRKWWPLEKYWAVFSLWSVFCVPVWLTNRHLASVRQLKVYQRFLSRRPGPLGGQALCVVIRRQTNSNGLPTECRRFLLQTGVSTLPNGMGTRMWNDKLVSCLNTSAVRRNEFSHHCVRRLKKYKKTVVAHLRQ